jgi:hypothetical protein
MRTTALALFAAVAALAAAQPALTYRDAGGNMTLRNYRSFSFNFPGEIIQFDLRGSGNQPVQGSWQAQGLEIAAARLQGEVLARSPQGGSQIRTLTATGNVRAVKTAGAVRTEVTGAVATFRSQAQGASVDLRGPVRIVHRNAQNRQTAIVTGASGTVGLGATRNVGVRNATLSGNVRIEVLQAPRAGQRESRMIVTGNQLTLNNTARPATMTLTGNITATGTGDSAFGNLQGARRAVITLNEAWEMTGMEITSG